MDILHHDYLVVDAVNAVLGPAVAVLLGWLGWEFAPGEQVIPDYLVMCMVIVAFMTAICLILRSQLSVEDPGKLQIVLEDLIGALHALLVDNIGPKGSQYITLVGTIGIFILTANMMGMVPGFMPPTSNVNVPLGCALTVFVYYHVQGLRAQGGWHYFRHFLAPPGVPVAIAIIYFPIEVISHLSRVLSLTVRLFGNVFGEKLVVLILFSIIPFLVPLPMMFLGIIIGSLQAFIFVMLTVIYLAGAVAVEHGDEHGVREEHREAVPA
jgi:F-type H+-transporting ATPase subunit a